MNGDVFYHRVKIGERAKVSSARAFLVPADCNSHEVVVRLAAGINNKLRPIHIY